MTSADTKTKSVYPCHKTLSQLFEEQVEAYPHHVALIFRTQTLSYAELNAKANQLAHYLRKLGVGNNTLVPICVESSLELIIGILGILKAGGAYIPLDPNNLSERQQFILEDIHASVFITQATFMNNFENTDVQFVCLDTQGSQINDCITTNPTHINDANSLAYVIYTSGSTGKPKGVMITQRNIQHFIHWFAKALSITHEDIFDFSSSIAFDFSVATTIFPIMVGAKIAICPEASKQDPYLYLQHLIQTQVSIFKITPSHFRQFKEVVLNEQISLPLKYVIFGGETLYVRDLKDWLAQFPKHTLFCEYGPTEATVATSWIKVNQNNINHFINTIPIGEPALNAQLYILNDHMQTVGIDELGELYIGGDGVAAGYLNREESTKQAFIKDPFHNDPKAKIYKTGDFCRLLADGNIEFVEREDFQIKIRGFRVETAEIENCLILHASIKDAVVLINQSQMDQTEEKELIAYCVPKKGVTLDTHELRQYLQHQLPDYMVPAFIVSINALPLSANGKLDRKKLPAPEALMHHSDVVPHSALELILKNIWLETLHLKEIGIEDNFFELGGNSLSAARIITKVKQTMKKEIKLQDFYRSPTISSLAKMINQLTEITETQLDNKESKNTYSNKIPLNELQFLFWLMRLFYSKSRVMNIIGRRRVAGKLDIKAINYAFEAVCYKHPVLCYHVSRYYPIQFPQKITKLRVFEKDISHLSSQQQEHELLNSLNELEHFSWKQNSPLIMVRLFYLQDEISEVQIAMSHFISDEISIQIIFDDFSQYYLSYEIHTQLNIVPGTLQYKHYIQQENQHLNDNLSMDIQFWETHLKNVSLFTFPPQYIKENIITSCTTYLEIPENDLKRLQTLCSKNHLSITDSLCAAVASVLVNYLEKANKVMAINLVKSTRYIDVYDKTIGLFVRSDLIKIDLNQSPKFIELSKQIQNSIADSAPYQPCPAIVKLGCLLKNEWKNKKLANFFIKLISKTSALIFYKSKLNQLVLMMFGRVYLVINKHRFFVDVNILNNFIIANTNTNNSLFGYPLQMLKPYQQDKIVADEVLNVWFDRDDHNKAYLILSGKLTSGFQHKLGQEIINTISQKTSI